jgi:hypothetical protein
MTIFARWFVPTFGCFQVTIGVTVTGMPLSAPLPAGSSMHVGGMMFVFTKDESVAIASRVPGSPRPPIIANRRTFLTA